MTGRRALCCRATGILVLALALPTDQRAQAEAGPVGMTSGSARRARRDHRLQFNGIVSGNGRYVASASGTHNLVPGDHNGESTSSSGTG